MTSEQNKPRKWWISGWGKYPIPDSYVLTVFVTNNDPGKKEAFEVIEFSAYQKLEQELADLKVALSGKTYFHDNDAIEKELADAKTEIARLKFDHGVHVADIQQEHFKVLDERDRWKEQAEKLASAMKDYQILNGIVETLADRALAAYEKFKAGEK